MWSDRWSSAPAPIGDSSATAHSAIPPCQSQSCSRGTRTPRRASTRTARTYSASATASETSSPGSSARSTGRG
jgi:hypothetical protein